MSQRTFPFQAGPHRHVAGRFLCIAFASLLLAHTANADRVVARYVAGLEGNPAEAPSPATLGWNAVNPTNDLQNFINGPVSPDGGSGLNAWRTLDNSTATSQFITWTHPVAAADHASATEHGWTLAARVRIADPVANNAGNRTVTFSYGNGSRRWLFFFDVNAAGHLVVDLWGGSSAVTTLTITDLDLSKYHEHQLVWNPATNNTDYLVNGVVRHTGYNGASNSFNGVRFGTESTGGRGDGHWNEVVFAVDEPVISPPRPVVVAHPESAIAPAGGAVTLTAAFSGTVTDFQWFKEGAPIPGAEAATLTLDPLAASNDGEYWCRAFNGPEVWSETDTAAVMVLVPGAGLRVNEFLATNGSGIRDEDGSREDWIEIFNADTAPVSTAGWHLTDRATDPLRWALPVAVMQPGEFRVVFASGKNRTTPKGEWHTNFSLSADGEEVALTRPYSLAASVIVFGPQVADVSMGYTANGWRYFDEPTNGAPNLDGRMSPGTAQILFDPPPGVHEAGVHVNVTTQGTIPPGAVLRYTTDDSRPDWNSPVVDGQIAIAENTALRVALIAPGERYGIPASAPYLISGMAAGAFSSPLPMVILSNFGAGDVPGVSGYGPNNDGSQVIQAAPQSQMMAILESAPGQNVSLQSPATAWTRAGLRRRGSSSFSFSRRSYRVNTWGERGEENRNISLLGMPGENDWVLYAPDPSQFDITLIHNAFTYELARRSGFNAPRYRLVEVFLDINGDGVINMNDHRGLHMLVETVKRDSQRVPFSLMSNDGTQGGWMVSVDRMDSLPPGGDPAIMIPRQFHTAGPDGILQTPDDVARGYKGTGGGGGLDPIRDDQPNAYHSFFNFDSPRGWDILPAQRNAIQTAMRDFDAALYGSNYQNELLGWAPHIDAGNWAHHLAIHQLARNQDAIILSSYLFRETPQSPIRWASVWDFDRAYRRMDSNPNNNLTWGHNRLFYQRLITDPEFAQVHVDIWQQLRRGAFATQKMHALIDELAAAITPVVAARSGINATTWQTNITNMKSWLATRAASIDALDPSPPVFSNPGGPMEPRLVLSMSVSSGTIHVTTDGSDPRSRGGAPSPAASIYSAPITITGPMTVTARTRAANGKWSGPVTAIYFPAETGPRFLPGGNASWHADANWESGATPNGPGQAATINRPASANRTVTLASATTIGSLLFEEEDSTFLNRLQGAAPRTLTFSSGTPDPARLKVTGSGTGYVEFDINAGVALTGGLTIDIPKTSGNPEYGALRLRRSWTGPGGIRKEGLGIAALNGEGKDWLGETVIAEGVLIVTSNGAPVNTSVVRVFDGGQLRLTSTVSPVYTFGGPVFIAGSGRGVQIPDDAGQGKLGAIRYEPGSTGNHATLTNRVEIAANAGIHIATLGNQLTLAGGLAGNANLTKSGGGTLVLPDNPHGFTGALHCASGSIVMRGGWTSSIVTDAATTIDAAGTCGGISGNGLLRVTGSALDAGNISNVSLELTFLPGTPSIIADGLNTPASIDLFFANPSEARHTGGIVLPTISAWNTVDLDSIRVFAPDSAGSRAFNGQQWSELQGVTVTRVPSPWPEHPGAALQLRMDGSPADYGTWADGAFPVPDDRTNPPISGPTAAPFGDGISNLLRFALGTDANGRVRLPSVERGPGGLPHIRFPFDPGLRGVRWRIEAVDNPAFWQNAEILFDSHSGILPAADGFIEVVDDSGLPRRFFRLRLDKE
ncbi:MAG: CotH kinase family protein [Verrucomicrobiales bacterium]